MLGGVFQSHAKLLTSTFIQKVRKIILDALLLKQFGGTVPPKTTGWWFQILDLAQGTFQDFGRSELANPCFGRLFGASW